MKNRIYVAIDLKSFYASVECVERGLDPLAVNLVVADSSRTEKTICLAVSPSLKAFGIPGRPRLFEVVQKVREINSERRRKAPKKELQGSSYFAQELQNNASLALDYITATPRMALYIQYSTRIYRIYLRYIAPEDIHVYSIDEVFMDVTDYLQTYGMTAKELTMRIIHSVLSETGITATAGIGTNLYLAKIAMDIKAKHIPPDKDGVRIAELDEQSYRQSLWEHRPLTDFWRIGHGYASKLERRGMFTMGDVARHSLYDEEIFYKLFGVNAELLIDHAWGWESCTMKDIKSFRPQTNSLSSGQVLQMPYTYEKGLLVIKEMTQSLVLDLIEKRLVTNQMVLYICYDAESLQNETLLQRYKDTVTTDYYGRIVPKPAHGHVNLPYYTSSNRIISDAVVNLCGQILDHDMLIRRINITAEHIIPEDTVPATEFEQLNMFTDYTAKTKQEEQKKESLKRERSMQEAVLKIKHKYGKNAIFKAMNLQDGATAMQRNEQIGGHKA